MPSCAIVSKVLLLLLIVICFVFWIIHSGYYCRRYVNRIKSVQTQYEQRKQLTLPNLVICNREPLNMTAVRLNSLANNNFIRYAKEIMLPDMNRPSATWKQSWPDYRLIGGANQFENHFNQTGRNRSSIEMLLYQCPQMISQCWWKNKQKNIRFCCDRILYIPTPRGVCMQMDISTLNQTKPGIDNGLRIRLEFQQSTYQLNFQAQNDNPGFELFLRDLDDDIYSIKNFYPLENGRGYRLELEMEKMISLNEKCPTESRGTQGNCIGEKISRECGCEPMMSLWNPNKELVLQKVEAELCTLNESHHCAMPLLQQWKLERFRDTPKTNRKAPEKNKNEKSDCHMKRPCSPTTWQVEASDYVVQSNADFFTEFTIYYKYFQVRIIAEYNSFTIVDLLSHIGFAAAWWFTVVYIIVSLVKCFDRKPNEKNQQVVHIDRSVPQITVSIQGENFQQTQTD